MKTNSKKMVMLISGILIALNSFSQVSDNDFCTVFNSVIETMKNDECEKLCKQGSEKKVDAETVSYMLNTLLPGYTEGKLIKNISTKPNVWYITFYSSNVKTKNDEDTFKNQIYNCLKNWENTNNDGYTQYGEYYESKEFTKDGINIEVSVNGSEKKGSYGIDVVIRKK